jgi:hypothetical protein
VQDIHRFLGPNFANEKAVDIGSQRGPVSFVCGFDRLVQSHAHISLPTAKITTHPMRSRKIETARSLCFLNS